MKTICTLALLTFLSPAFATDQIVPATPELESAVRKFTDAKISRVETNRSGFSKTYEVKFDMASNSAIKEIELTQKDFQLVEAEGVSLNGNFTPQGLKSLREVATALEQYPKFNIENWDLEKRMRKWVYKVSGVENGIEREYYFDATTLALIKAKND